MKTFSKMELTQNLENIRSRGWIINNRANNDGGVGNTLEDLLGIAENNLPIPNAGEWELKCQKSSTSALTTLFHCEPSPRALRFVPQILLPHYGWTHQGAGTRYPETELSFRQTINTSAFSNRGFKVIYNEEQTRVEIKFDYNLIDESMHAEWKSMIDPNVRNLSVIPYWGIHDLFHKLGDKLNNCFYVLADTKRESGISYIKYDIIIKLENIAMENFCTAIKDGHVYVDFDARTGHNHGTKLRIKQKYFTDLYANVTNI